MDTSELLKAQSPAALAEEYIVKSIWNHHFPAGSDLPAERELADIIGVTRTTLREVLQRLARDGWLNIQHGKPTRVNNVWETAGPNIIGTLIKLDRSITPMIISNVVSLRTRMGEYYIPEAIRLNPEAAYEAFQDLDDLVDDACSFARFDYKLYHQFTFIADKPVYGLILNSFQELYHKVAELVFNSTEFRQTTLAFYRHLKQACRVKDSRKASDYIAMHRQASTVLWADVLKQLPENFGE
ncbi:fatty acid metabolism transcriptional regulator FadR [Muribacter muris]|uniref:Fatty acid metabolism regulator protein n=1 Tax=Muribacter muris TaxID=67855 RepID=A0A4Y9K7R6_9PAST|nr:fatty acid metabolism transcriptional regulator FadR [Muribacter muris]MBF0784159.1 fatty acid metabolism transcriptional regulator FadR [Muribacter muris]MBF0827654.1 fatty acid metabolism transcriptional regulator FadR [Muribacter muris]TFV13209.1 fatty acid metabolism transcriptional regulator FadR [Muribacter muris]